MEEYAGHPKIFSVIRKAYNLGDQSSVSNGLRESEVVPLLCKLNY